MVIRRAQCARVSAAPARCRSPRSQVARPHRVFQAALAPTAPVRFPRVARRRPQHQPPPEGLAG
jgi:hypothetical protein